MRQAAPFAALPDPTYRAEAALAAEGCSVYNRGCVACHGYEAESGGIAPDLCASAVPQSADLRRGGPSGRIQVNGTPRFADLDDANMVALRQFCGTARRIYARAASHQWAFPAPDPHGGEVG